MMMMMTMTTMTRGGEMSNVMLFGSGFPVMQWHIPEECNHKIYKIYILTSKSESLKL
jgi:hypothetical protein